eukprot:scaffold16563_cov66-Phaeocystis_antarctica.AAC.3
MLPLVPCPAMQRPKRPQWLRSGSGSGLGLGLAQWLCGTRQTRERIRNGEAGRNEAGPRRGGKADWSTWLGLGLGSGSGSGLAEGQGALVKMVDAARARTAVVRPLLAHARVAVRRQIGALELAWAAPPDAATHAVRAELLVLQVLEALERLAPLQPLGHCLRQREAGLGAALDGTWLGLELGLGLWFGFGFGLRIGFGSRLWLGLSHRTGVAVEDAQQAADGKEGLQVNGQEEEPPPAAVCYDGAVAEGAKVRGQHAHERDA